MLKHASRAIFLAAILLTAACGEKPTPQPAPAIETTDRERRASEVRVDPAAAADMISLYRREHALSAVQTDSVLQKFAQAQANAMAAHDPKNGSWLV